VELKIKQEDYNALLKRKEVYVEVDHDEAGTPSRIELRRTVATRYGTKPENVYVVDIETKTGTQRAVCEIQVYDDPESALRIVPKYIQTRNLPPEERKRMKEQQAKKEEAKKEAKPAKPEKPKAEKPKEEKLKEEAKPPPAEAAKKSKESETK
jgi:ribosomal protein S24E